MKILLGTDNRGKRDEMRSLLASINIEILLPAEIGLHLDVREDGSTYAENAALKANAYCQASGILTLADDSGLEVDPLGGEPGVFSKRYLPKPEANDAERRAYLLHKLTSIPRPWGAHFHCTMALAAPPHHLDLFDGDCFGEIIPEERGMHGFGYDPIFLVAGKECTMAELNMSEKNRISHRALAFQAALPTILGFIERDR